MAEERVGGQIRAPVLFSLGLKDGRMGITMLKRSFGAFCILAVCLGTISCQKRESLVYPKVTGPLALEPAKFADAIPNDYGTLVGVTESARNPGWVGLWFQRSDKTITAVFVNIEQGKIHERVLTIPRK